MASEPTEGRAICAECGLTTDRPMVCEHCHKPVSEECWGQHRAACGAIAAARPQGETEAWLAECKARCEAATPGDWVDEWDDETPTGCVWIEATEEDPVEEQIGHFDYGPDAKLAAHAHQDLPRALAIAREQAARIGELEAEAEQARLDRDELYMRLARNGLLLCGDHAPRDPEVQQITSCNRAMADAIRLCVDQSRCPVCGCTSRPRAAHTIVHGATISVCPWPEAVVAARGTPPSTERARIAELEAELRAAVGWRDMVLPRDLPPLLEPWTPDREQFASLPALGPACNDAVTMLRAERAARVYTERILHDVSMGDVPGLVQEREQLRQQRDALVKRVAELATARGLMERMEDGLHLAECTAAMHHGCTACDLIAESRAFRAGRPQEPTDA